MADIFISYAKTDRPDAEQLARVLTKEGWDVWWDPHIDPGEDFDEIIEAQLEAAQCVVVLWSKRSRKSRYVKGEARVAMAQGKLVPAFIEKVTPPLDFHSIQGVFLDEWDGDAGDAEYQKLVRRLARRVEEASPVEEVSSELAQAEVTKPPAKKETRRVVKARPARSVQNEKPQQTAQTASSDRKPGSIFRDQLKNGSEAPEMVVIPAGSFLMGSPEGEANRSDDEGPQHKVTLSKPFAMGRFPVTFDEYDHFAEAVNRMKSDDRGWGRGRRPVINVSWNDALAYCEWLSKETGKVYRLPSEAEWEYACRADTTTAYYWGDAPGRNRANFDGSGSEWSDKQTSPVGSFDENPWGLHDTSGNVWEWVQDCWHRNYQGAPADGAAWLEEGGGECGRRVIRGGSWNLEPGYARAASRYRLFAGLATDFVGVRLAQDL